jgi:2-polyprenyl-3-methyl-5-hydroxy-6-metoxy-1,4-benzoquinol methylase/glycosyltransferase involved in cell wall biosynthesis
MKYQAIINTSNKNNSHTQAFDRIQEFSSGRPLKILEVGCSSGYFGGALVDQGHEVWGVEPFDEAARKASEILHKVHIGFIEDFFTKNAGQNFDVIMFGDVLEHLADPESVLKQSKDFLSARGIIVASIPNIAHFSVRAMMLEGRWEYSDLGILDRTHLRFFTRNSIVDLFNESGYKVLSLSSIRLSAEQVDEICKLNIRKESIDYVKKFCADDRGFDFQYIVSACPCEDTSVRDSTNFQMKIEEGLRVLCLVHDPSSSIVDIRIRSPLNRWASICGGHVKILSIYDFDLSNLSWADVVVFQREATEYITSLAIYIRSLDKKIVFEIDDLITELPPFLSHHADAINKSLPHIHKLLEFADAISVSSPVLLQKFQLKNSSIFITPNFSEPMNNIALHSQVPPSDITLVVASSDSVLVDMLASPLKALQRKYGLQIIVIGPPGEQLEEWGLDITRVPNLSHDEFKKFIASVNNGVGLIPLDSSEFSSAKTAVKYFDYSMCGIPSICSDVLPYSQIVDNELSGLLVGNAPDDWIRAIESLVISCDRRNALALNARECVMRDYNIDISAKKWGELFDSLQINFSKRNNERLINFSFNRNRLQAFFLLMPHLIKPNSYIRLFKVLGKHGIRGVFERVIRR